MHFLAWFLVTIALLGVAFAVGFVAEWLSKERRGARRRARSAPMASYLRAPGSPLRVGGRRACGELYVYAGGMRAVRPASTAQCAQCREVYAGSRVHHVTVSGWHRQWAERDWQVRAGLR